MKRTIIVALNLIMLGTFFLVGCNSQNPAPESQEIILATTTSTYDSGLLDALIPVFEEQSGYIVKIISVGTGKALTMGEEGNADLLLVHAPSAEMEFMNGGYGVERQLIMHNDFVIVGPSADPAGIGGSTAVPDVFTKIASSKSPFATRGDDSGTHKKERLYWQTAEITPAGEWYFETGQGMGATLQIASEKSAYTLTDRATFLSLRDVLSLEILVEGDASLLNVYHTMIVNPDRWPAINLIGAQDLTSFLISDDAQAIIAEFGIEEYGQPLFFPDADKTDADFGLLFLAAGSI